MTAKRSGLGKGLGKGLDSLIPDNRSTEKKYTFEGKGGRTCISRRKNGENQYD